jgi:hypothetical protein
LRSLRFILFGVQGEALSKFFGGEAMATKENVLTRTDDFIKWFLPKLEKFPRNYKFLFGDRLVEIQLDVLENLIEAYYQKEKLVNLRQANIGVEKLRHLLQISTEMRFLSFDQLEYATRSLNQIGSLIGGWIRQQEGKPRFDWIAARYLKTSRLRLASFSKSTRRAALSRTIRSIVAVEQFPVCSRMTRPGCVSALYM